MDTTVSKIYPTKPTVDKDQHSSLGSEDGEDLQGIWRDLTVIYPQ
jgi:hypothetical protein